MLAFEPNTEAEWTKEEDHLARMTEATGESFPMEMLEKSKHRSRYFTEQGAWESRETS
jgi:serine/threonine-protein kinase SRPK3